MKNYKVNITFFFQAEDANNALGIADNMAGYIEDTFGNGLVHPTDVEAKVGRVMLEKKEIKKRKYGHSF